MADTVKESDISNAVLGNPGNDTVSAGSNVVAFGTAAGMTFLSGGGGSFVFGGSGNAAVSGGLGAATVFGGGDGGSRPDLLVAGGGNETLSGGGVYFGASGLTATGEQYLGGSGSDAVVASLGPDVFTLDNFAAGPGNEIGTLGLGSQPVHASGAVSVFNIASVSGGSTSVNLADGTTVRLIGIADLKGSPLG